MKKWTQKNKNQYIYPTMTVVVISMRRMNMDSTDVYAVLRVVEEQQKSSSICFIFSLGLY